MNVTAHSRIHAAGLDITDVRRFRGAVERSHGLLIRRVFSARERAEWAAGAGMAELASAFGIKESVVKIVGGMPRGARYADISVGATRLIGLRGEFARWALEREVDLVAFCVPIQDQIALSWVLARKRSRRP